VTDSHSSGRPADSQDPYFFHSYAQLPDVAADMRAPDERQEAFHALLCQFLLLLTTHEGESPIGFLDKRMPWAASGRGRLAERIVDVATAARLKPCDVELLDDLSNVFAPRTQGAS
jgi:hypothetical protein